MPERDNMIIGELKLAIGNFLCLLEIFKKTSNWPVRYRGVNMSNQQSYNCHLGVLGLVVIRLIRWSTLLFR